MKRRTCMIAFLVFVLVGARAGVRHSAPSANPVGNPPQTWHRPDGAAPESGGTIFQDGSPHALGLVEQDPRERPEIQIVDAATCRLLRTALPPAVDNSAYLPPVGDQGAQGSCVCWAVGYNCKTHAEAREHGWDPSDPAHQFSPAFLYHQTHGRPSCDGTSYWDVFDLTRTIGCSTMGTMPYDPNDCESWPTDSAYREAINYRTGAGYAVDMTAAGSLDVIRSHLAAGNVALTGVRVYENLDNVQNYGYNYCLSQVTGTNRGGHGVCVVGYDDNRVTADGLGAFRCVNSWGPNFGDHGFFWITYQAVADPNRLISDGWYSYFDEVVGDHAETAARFELSDARFADVNVVLGRGPSGSPLADILLYQWNCFISIRGTDVPAPDTPVWVDLGQFGSVPQDSSTFLKAWNLDPANGVTGQIGSLSLVRMADGEMVSATSTPLAIPADGTQAVATVEWTWPDLLTCSSSADVSSGAPPLVVHFQASASGGTPPYSYEWDFGDGTTGSEENPSHTYTQSGTFSAVARVADSASGSVSAAPLAVAITVPPPHYAYMQKKGNPFRIAVSGTNFQNGILVFIGGDAAPWPTVTWKNASRIVIGGGASLKAKVPKYTPTQFRFLNPDGGEADVTWSWP